MPQNVRIDVMERPAQAFQNLLMADAPAAARSLIQPDELTPDERDAMLKRMGLGNSPWTPLYRMATNPLLLASLALSHVFPVASPQKMMKLGDPIKSMAKRFPLLGRLTGPFSLFRGTEVPEVLSDIAADKEWVRLRFGLPLTDALVEFKQVTGRTPNRTEQVMLAAWMDGLHKPLRGWKGIGALVPDLEKKMSAPMRKLAGRLDGWRNDVWDNVFAKLENRKQAREAMARLRGTKFWNEDMEAMFEHFGLAKRIEDYFPHRIVRGENEMRAIMRSLVADPKKEDIAKKAEYKMLTFLGPEFRKREGGMIPSLDDLQQIRHLVDRDQYGKLLGQVKGRLLNGARKMGLREKQLMRLEKMELPDIMSKYQDLLEPGERTIFFEAIAREMPSSYSLKLQPVLSEYVNSVGGTYAWTVRGGGMRMKEQAEFAKLAGRESPWALRRAEMLENTYVPMAMGRGKVEQHLKAATWDHEINQMAVFLEKPAIKKVLGTKLTGYLKEKMGESSGAFSLINLHRKGAGYLYLSTLGMNPMSAAKNTSNLVLMLGPKMGFRQAGEGVMEAMRKSEKYFKLRLGSPRLSHERALLKAWPEFAESGLASAPITSDVLDAAYRNAYEIQSLPGASEVANLRQRVSRGMMSLFTATETGLRVASWETGMLAAKRAGMKRPEAMKFARRVVQETQFPGSLTNTPYVLTGAGALWKALGQFPLKALEFAGSRAWRIGADPDKTGLGGINPGTFARMVAGSTIAYELGNLMGLDMGDAMLGGAVPTFREYGPLAPLPIVPPFVALIGSFAQGAVTGDMSEFMLQTPLLVPGGVSAARGVGLLPPGVPGAEAGRKVAEAIGRNYADYENQTPDGRVPVYTAKGSLKGFYTKWDLVKAGLGVKAGDTANEQQVLSTLIKNRDQIRESRRAYAEALFANDPRRAQKIARDYETQFGHPIPVSEKDLEALQERRMMTRMEQMILTLPKEARPQYAKWLGEVFGANAEKFLGVDPALLGMTGAEGGQARRRARTQRQRQGGSPRRPGPYLNQMGPYDEVSPYKIGQTRPVPQSNTGF